MSDYITISRTTSNKEPFEYVSIDVRHGSERVKVEMTMTDFALAITGRGLVPVDVTRWPEGADTDG